MSLNHSPSVVTDGLVLYYDMNNTKKSFKGAPTTNLATSQTLVNHSLVTLPTFSDAPEKGDGWKKVIVTATSSNFRMLKMDTFSVAANSTTTYSIEFECNSPEVYLNIDGTGFGGGAWTKIGTTRYSRTVTTATAGSAYLFINSNNLNANVFYVIYYKEYQIENNSFATPYVNGTRSNTQALVDLTNNNTITASSLTYAADNTFSFNGTSNYITSPLTVNADPLITVNQWIRRTSTITGGAYWGIGADTVNTNISGFTSVTDKIGWDLYGRTTFHTGVDYPLSQWVNVCWVKNNTTFTTSTLKIYINGVDTPLTTTVRNNSSVVNVTSNITIGRVGPTLSSYYAPGDVAVTQVYSRALTAAEVSRNFNALRGRYGL